MTSFNEIHGYYLKTISNDYRIRNLYETDSSLAEDLLDTWLLEAIVSFQLYTKVNLEDSLDVINREFTSDLGLTVKFILCDLMVFRWLEWNINDITQMNLSLNDLDFKRFSEERNLSSKQSHCDSWREKTFHKMSMYCESIETDEYKWWV